MAATAEYLDEAREMLPPAFADKFAHQMRGLIKVGGPVLVRKRRGRARGSTAPRFARFFGPCSLRETSREKEDAQVSGWSS